MTIGQIFLWVVIGLPFGYMVTSNFQRDLELPRRISRGDDWYEYGVLACMFIVCTVGWPVVCAVAVWVRVTDGPRR